MTRVRLTTAKVSTLYRVNKGNEDDPCGVNQKDEINQRNLDREKKEC